MGPVVGIVGYAHVVPRPWGNVSVSGVPTPYVDAVLAAGGRPVILPGDQAATLIDLVDALVLTGGDDLGADADRDRQELALVAAALSARVPTLGVCRGLQVLAAATGGQVRGGVDSHVVLTGGHAIETAHGSLARRLLGARPDVNSLHHQHVTDPGSGRVTARADDGVVEAVEWDDWPALGVQWHPELGDGTATALFGWLVETGQQAHRKRTGSEATLVP